MRSKEQNSACGDDAKDRWSDNAGAESNKEDENEDETGPKLEPSKLMEIVIMGSLLTISMNQVSTHTMPYDTAPESLRVSFTDQDSTSGLKSAQPKSRLGAASPRPPPDVSRTV